MISLDSLYERDGGVCRVGGHSISRAEATRDHIMPRSVGGNDRESNIQLSCGPCNVAKGSKWDGARERWGFLPEYGPIGAPSRSVL